MSLNELPPRIQAKIVVDSNGCWIWQPSPSEQYGRCYLNGKWTTAHRATYELLVGPIPSDRCLDHTCLVKRCANPAHLDLVTTGENNRRAIAHNQAVALAEYRRLGGF